MEYLQSEYGENAINAVLHLDEQTPHIHAFITPIENKNGIYKLNNKSYMKNTKQCRIYILNTISYWV